MVESVVYTEHTPPSSSGAATRMVTLALAIPSPRDRDEMPCSWLTNRPVVLDSRTAPYRQGSDCDHHLRESSQGSDCDHHLRESS